jgi:hypothetical protein
MLRYRWDNADAVNGTVFVSGQGLSIPAEGAHALYLYARDVAGNVSQWQGNYRQDTLKPEILANKNQFVWYRTPIGPITVLLILSKQRLIACLVLACKKQYYLLKSSKLLTMLR